METQPKIINELQRALVGGDQHLLEKIPATLKVIIKQEAWKQCSDKEGIPFQNFEAFVRCPLWFGLECTIDDLLAYCRKRDDIQKLIRAEVGALHSHEEAGALGGRGKKACSNAMGFSSDRGATYTLRRLKRDKPELAKRVIDGELTANAAAIKAGFRMKTINVPLDPERAAKALRKHFTSQEIKRLISALT